MAGDGPEGRVVDRRGVWWTGRESRRLERSWRATAGPESDGVVNGRIKSAKRGLSVCTEESPFTTGQNVKLCSAIERVITYTHTGNVKVIATSLINLLWLRYSLFK
jgi:hypothetical protein